VTFHEINLFQHAGGVQWSRNPINPKFENINAGANCLGNGGNISIYGENNSGDATEFDVTYLGDSPAFLGPVSSISVIA